MEQASERAMRIAEEIIRRTTTEHYRLVLNEERKPSVTDSKIGGIPYWPADKEYPVDQQGKPMLLLMQVNCAQAELREPLPDHGMIQWFISLNPEWMYGCRGNYDDQGAGFRIVYHDEMGESATPAGVPTHGTVDDMLTPVKCEVAIDFVIEQTAMGVSDGRFNQLFFDIVKEITGAEHTGMMWYQYLDNDDCLYFEKELGMGRPSHQILGYPHYSQDEARRSIEIHDTLLFQLDSQFSTIDRKALVMWGDMGSGFIFINRDDLAARDFTRTYYCWDCG
ncbi:MAG: DUF1963 domain-containing protein [Muribaculaceae bacterium]|nr:DUF1963 domain-containing protein [Muribaculaceae bacterium]